MLLCYAAAWMGGEFGGEWIHVYVWLSPLADHLKLSLLQNLIASKRMVFGLNWKLTSLLYAFTCPSHA